MASGRGRGGMYSRAGGDTSSLGFGLSCACCCLRFCFFAGADALEEPECCCQPYCQERHCEHPLQYLCRD
eukprot:12916296-Prorocentrum_lima.AAC.1